MANTAIMERNTNVPDDATRGLILVVCADRKTQRIVHRILGATLYHIDAVDNLVQARKLLAQRAPSLIVLDHKSLLDDTGAAFVAQATAAGARGCLVLLENDSASALPSLFTVDALTNLLANPMPLLAEELTVTALKLLRNDIFGIEKYLSWGIESRTVELDNALQRAETVDSLTADVRAFGLGPRVASLASLAADELLSNALYNAPVDAEGNNYRAGEPRDSFRELDAKERVTLRYGCDARYLAIEVTDRFGSLDRQTILSYLAKAAERGGVDKIDFSSAGAGMGIALTYSCCNHLIYNLEPGRCTQAIGLIDVRFKPTELGSMVSSFNVFTRDPGDSQ